jgi:hypothetical protein
MERNNQIGQIPAPPQRPRNIMAPARHEGIGNALRTAYDPAMSSLPDDMKNLLAALG